MVARTSCRTANARELEARGINTAIPYTVDQERLTDHAPDFTGKRVINDKGERATPTRPLPRPKSRPASAGARAAEAAVPAFLALEEASDLPQHDQWFIAMDKPIADNGKARPGDTLRAARCTRSQ
jgi:isoleucyl-tRNA synthetase